jgi:membrane-associated phospholipid phosphatase
MKDKAGLFSRKSILTAFLVSLTYLLVSILLIGFRTDQLALTLLFNICFFLSPTARKFITGFSIFIIYWILFDYMKAFPNYTFNTVHIQDLYDAEKFFFGISGAGKTITPNEYWLQHSRTWLDLLSGVFYLCWIPVPLAFAAYLFFTDKALFLHFSLTFVLVNLLGFVIYYAYPAAPPWYYQLYGAHFIPGTPGNTATLHKFDDFLSLNVFRSLYAKSSNVFAAMPSLHSSYPLIVLFYGVRKKLGWMNIVFAVVALGIWFAAVYTGHHYILDVLAGVVCAGAGILIFQKLLLPNRRFARFLRFYEANI